MRWLHLLIRVRFGICTTPLREVIESSQKMDGRLAPYRLHRGRAYH